VEAKIRAKAMQYIASLGSVGKLAVDQSKPPPGVNHAGFGLSGRKRNNNASLPSNMASTSDAAAFPMNRSSTEWCNNSSVPRNVTLHRLDHDANNQSQNNNGNSNASWEVVTNNGARNNTLNLLGRVDGTMSLAMSQKYFFVIFLF
jgi:hypothetical protein